MVATYGVLSNYVNRVRHRHGQPPERNSVMRAVIMVLGINIATKAAVVGNVTRPGVDAALTVIQSEDQGLLAAVLSGRATRAADKVRGGVKLIEAFKSATPDDRAHRVFDRPGTPVFRTSGATWGVAQFDEH